ncbi:hypothetical protein FPV67DRAFT_196314 [Lyophyllum atratum]|nr:hypothetical protein FPV67DRAFT_196314 [Lyophyllum atratum]
MDKIPATDVPSDNEIVDEPDDSDESGLSFFTGRGLQFRILILGRANAGKTTILERLTGASRDQAQVWRDGSLLNSQTIEGQSGRGLHNVEDEIRFPSRPGFVFHDSLGIEAGSSTELSTVRKFAEYRSSEAKNIKEQLHAIWMCLPLDDSRDLSEAEKDPFCWLRGDTPLIIIFTKRDGAVSKATQDIIGGSSSSRAFRKQARMKAETHVTEHLKKRQEGLKQLSQSEAALAFITTSDMQELTDESARLCNDLISLTEQGLRGPKLKALLSVVWHRNILQTAFWLFYWTLRTNANEVMLGSGSPLLHKMVNYVGFFMMVSEHH